MSRSRVAGPLRVRARRLAPVLLLIAVALAGCGGAQDTDNQLHGFVRSPPQRVGAVALPDVARHAPAPLALRARPGQLLLVYFGYTFCPDICPTTLADLHDALGRLTPAQRSRVAVAMVTVDPHRDTPKVLNGYLSHFFASWHALRTTSPATLRRAERAFGARSHIGPKDRHGDYSVSHTAEVYAVGPDGVVRVEWPFGTASADIAADLRTALAREAQPST